MAYEGSFTPLPRKARARRPSRPLSPPGGGNPGLGPRLPGVVETVEESKKRPDFGRIRALSCDHNNNTLKARGNHRARKPLGPILLFLALVIVARKPQISGVFYPITWTLRVFCDNDFPIIVKLIVLESRRNARLWKDFVNFSLVK